MGFALTPGEAPLHFSRSKNVMHVAAFDEEVHRYYDLRQADRPVDAFSDQVATISRQDVSHQTLLDKAAAQGFRLDQ